MDQTVIVVIIVYSLVNGFLAMVVADEKGHGGQWFLAGLLFGILGLIAAVGLPDRKKTPPLPAGLAKNCPDCSEPVTLLAKVCRYCGYRF